MEKEMKKIPGKTTRQLHCFPQHDVTLSGGKWSSVTVVKHIWAYIKSHYPQLAEISLDTSYSTTAHSTIKQAKVIDLPKINLPET
jgi:hypothetical protein